MTSLANEQARIASEYWNAALEWRGLAHTLAILLAVRDREGVEAMAEARAGTEAGAMLHNAIGWLDALDGVGMAEALEDTKSLDAAA